MCSLCFRAHDISCTSDYLPVSPQTVSTASALKRKQIANKHKNICVYIIVCEQVMATPPSPEDQVRVQETFDEVADSVSTPHLFTVL